MDYPVINQKLGYSYSNEKTVFKLWAPIRDNISLLLYENGETIKRDSYIMTKDGDGVHNLTINKDLKGYYYTYLIEDELEVTDPYSISSSLNSNRSAIINIKDTDPEGWEYHQIPINNNNTQAIIYEVHVKDFTFHVSSGVENKGKFLGMIEEKTEFKGLSTGISHLKDLGITHVHLLPIYDYLTVREDREYFHVDENYNWGYDPELYNVVEGSYSTKPEEPKNRIKELKEMIMAFHKEGIKVIIDVVYNHTYRSKDSNFNIIMPGYYHRFYNGIFSDGAGCGNEIASENNMVRKFILDSVLYWVDEFKIDGLRFDLMALTDLDTMGEVVSSLREKRPDILIYGEPWTGGTSTLPHYRMTMKGTQSKLGVAFFNDTFRDAIKGDNNGNLPGFSQGNMDFKMETKTGIAGSIYYNNSHIGFTESPIETINYINAHDDLIIYDKMKITFPHLDEEEIIRLNKFAFSILFTAQGIPFFHAGNEFLRTKYMISNTYNQPISINNIDWSLKEENLNYYNYFKDLIKLRKQYNVFTLGDADSVRERLKFLENQTLGVSIVYTLCIDIDKFLLVVHNANDNSTFISTTILLEHLNKSYNVKKSKIIIQPVLDINGLISENDRVMDYHPYGIEVDYKSTAVYELI